MIVLFQRIDAIARPATFNPNILKNNSFEAKLSSILHNHPDKEGTFRKKEDFSNEFQPPFKIGNLSDAKNVEKLEKKGFIVDILPKSDGNRAGVMKELKNMKLKPTKQISIF
ncbi:hypothetical protein niasHT_029153 [Heterodera trifolii]|uniref:Uncharacterized protein n=1 Tax=Heterodera trifolii TaxID=157864 RepID=A0ABD2JYQ4_9BILA